MTILGRLVQTEQTPMPRPNSSQLDHWLDEEIESLVRSIETEAEEVPAPPTKVRARPWRFSRISRRARGGLVVRRSNLVFYGLAVAVSLVLGWLIPFLDRP
jgi:hypothetical protein